MDSEEDADGSDEMVGLASDERDCLATEELRSAIATLSIRDLKRLEYVAINMTRGLALGADELVSNAVEASLTGRRRCPRGIPIAVFLLNVMRSLASAARKSPANRMMMQFPATDAGQENPVDRVPDTRGNPEEALLERDADEEASRVEAAAARAAAMLNEHLSGEFEAQICMQGMKEGLAGRELRECVGVDQAGLDHAKKKIRRASKKLFPEGWRNVQP
jgi:hypothetical protein